MVANRALKGSATVLLANRGLAGLKALLGVSLIIIDQVRTMTEETFVVTFRHNDDLASFQYDEVANNFNIQQVSPEEFLFSQTSQACRPNNLPVAQEISTDSPQTAEQVPSQGKAKAKAPRKDNYSKCLPQNIGSTILTLIPKILFGGQEFKKSDIKECKTRLKEFLEKNKANNNQLVLLFAYLFMVQENASEEQFRHLGRDLMGYLNKRIDESTEFEEEDRRIFLEKVEVNKRLVAIYFRGEKEELDFEEVRRICEKLFTGRQKTTIKKPLETLMRLQREMLREESEFLLLKPGSQLIESLFDSSSKCE